MNNTFVSLHILIFRKKKLNLKEIRNIFYDYFITPVAAFQSKKEVVRWIHDNERTNGNCHVFIIKKGE